MRQGLRIWVWEEDKREACVAGFCRTSHFTAPGLSYFICNMEITILTVWDC